MAQIAQSGSNRIYTRETDETGKSFIRVKGVSKEENHAFITMARHFHALGLPVPEVYSVSADEMEYTQEDLGDTILFDYLSDARKNGQFTYDARMMLERSLRGLAHIQTEGAVGLDWSVCYPVPAFDRRSIMWDLNYFKYDFLKLTGMDFSEPALEDDFEQLATRLLEEPCETFMYRDFQSRNVMIKDGKPYFIDFQGGRRGPIFYDLASFLWQAKANFPQSLREELIDAYLDEMHRIAIVGPMANRKQFRATLDHFVLFRTLQVLGAYGFRGLHEKKQHFIESIAPAIQNLQTLFAGSEELRIAYPTLAALAQTLSNQNAQASEAGKTPNNLTVYIYSFSFKKGIPADESGNGGGYVFDCRSTHNPGKYEEYKSLTGRDKEVIDFLEKDGEILTFLQHVWALADHHTERFIERGFTHLQLAFGCTGGQHRSVYCAEQTARHLHDKYGVHVILTHREQNIKSELV